MLKATLTHSIVKKSTLAAILLSLSSASANANVVVGGIYDVWTGSAWFGAQGLRVTAGTQASCVDKLNNVINDAQLNGWTLTTVNYCVKAGYRSFTNKGFAVLEDEYNIDEYRQKVEQVKLRNQLEADEEIEALKVQYRIEQFRAEVESQSSKEK